MTLYDLPQTTEKLPDWEGMLAALRDDAPQAVAVEGVTNAAKGMVLAQAYRRLMRPLLVLTYQPEQAMRLWDDLIRYGVPESRVSVLPSAQSLFLEGDITDFRAIGERIRALLQLADGEPGIVIGTAESVFQRTSPPGDLTPHVFTLEAETETDFEAVVKKLVRMGYDTASTVTRPGEFSRRGGILDVFPSTADAPVRIELFGDEIESIRTFDVSSQRSIAKQAFTEITPAREIRLTGAKELEAVHAIRGALKARQDELAASKTPDARDAIERLTERVETDLTRIGQGAYFDGLERYLPYLVPDMVCAADYLAANGIVVFDEPSQVRAHSERMVADIQAARESQWQRGDLLDISPNVCPLESTWKNLHEKHSTLHFSLLGMERDTPVKRKLTVQSAPLDPYRGRLNSLADDIGTWLANDCRILLVSDQPHRVREICAELKLPVQPTGGKLTDKPGLFILEGRPRAGFSFASLRLYLLTDAELFGSARPFVARRKVAGGVAISSVLDLKDNDYVVHIHHGIGQYRGLVKRKSDDSERDYLLIEYDGGRLYVPADQIDRVQRYIGTDAGAPKVNRIGGGEWQRTTRKVKEQAKQMAGELIRLYAARSAAERTPFGADTNWQEEMEEAFPYEETPGQLRAIEEVKEDLNAEKPMDRLICGDVGFGKTEVAIRAAFKVLMAGKQVAILCPTTVLAAQHHTTFSERLGAYPITVELLSRFRSKAEQAKTVQGLETGTVDIVIGTHRLLSKDVKFANLGLVVVDEEQRFGVKHKERLKELRTSVDVLTLSATPIPRTLSMALSGLRDMSVVSDPPEGRIPVITSVREYDDNMVRDAILRELERDGQIYFVHNKIESIHHVAHHLKRMIPDARIEVGHGQMSEDELERVMFDFYHHQFDILVCTTIIENGLDVPTANTMIVDNADHMGLSQLYQLRGRVGRSSRQAYCYLFYRRNKQLSEVAEKRLAAMKEFSALGSGYKVAMRDLEIRGAGNLLGGEQHGAMISVGFDLYCSLLAQAVAEMRGEEPQEDILPAMDIPVTAMIPSDYITGEAERIYFYKRMSGVRSVADVESLQAELDDRFGDAPRPVWDALAILRLRLRCKTMGILSVKSEGTNMAFRFAPNVRLTPEAIKLLTYVYKGLRFLPDGVNLPLKSATVLAQVEEMVTVLEKALQHGKEKTKR